MKQVLLSIDGSKRSIKSIDLVKSLYKHEQIDISIIFVLEDDGIRSKADYDQMKEDTMPFLDEIASKLEGYNVKKHVRTGEEILKFSESSEIDIIIIIMTKSTRRGWTQMIGSVTKHVVKYAKFIVMIIPE